MAPPWKRPSYRAAIIPVFQGKYEKGWKMLEAFLKKYPASPFAEDARVPAHDLQIRRQSV